MTYVAANPVVYNNAAAGFLAGVLRLQILEVNSESQVEPVDFATYVTAAYLFAEEVDTVLNSAESVPAPITNLVTEGGTVIPGSAAQANAAESTPSMVLAICEKCWAGRTLDPVTFATAAAYNPQANFVVAALLEWAATASVT